MLCYFLELPKATARIKQKLSRPACHLFQVHLTLSYARTLKPLYDYRAKTMMRLYRQYHVPVCLFSDYNPGVPSILSKPLVCKYPVYAPSVPDSWLYPSVPVSWLYPWCACVLATPLVCLYPD
jgi:hypothetical protein